MPGELLIRSAGTRDRDFVTGLVPSLLEFGSPFWDDAEGQAPGFRSVLAEAVSAQDSRAKVLIAQRADEERLGFISLKIRKDVTGVDRGHVADLAVVPRARGMGVGSALMRSAEAWAREQGLDLLGLDVWSRNDVALAFYRRLGYVVESLSLAKKLG